MTTVKPLKIGPNGPPKEFASTDIIPSNNLPAIIPALIQSSQSVSFNAAGGYFYQISISSANIDITIPSASGAPGQMFAVQIVSGGGASHYAYLSYLPGLNLYQNNDFMLLISDGTNWNIAAYTPGQAVTSAPSNGQILIGDNTHHSFDLATPGSTNSTIAWTTGAGTLSAAVAQVPSPCPVSNNADTAIARTSAGVLEVDNGTAGTWGLLNTGAQTIQQLATPAAPTITQGGSGASTHYTYAVSAVLADGATQTSISTGTQTTGGASTLNGTNYNIITWSAVTGATSYNIYRIASSGTPASTGLIGNTTGTTFHDTGIAGTTIWPNLNATGMLNAASNIYNGGRLYLVSGSPFADGSTSGNSTLYYGPCPNLGNLITLDNGSGVLQTFSFSEISLSLTSTGGDAYDVYIYNNSGSLSFATTVWSNATTPPSRSTDAAGRLTKSGETNYLLVGFFYAAGTNTTDDWTGARYVQNVFNKIGKNVQGAISSPSSWTTTSTTGVSANGNTTLGQGRVGIFADGINAVFITTNVGVGNSGANQSYWAIGVNSTSSFNAFTFTTGTSVQTVNVQYVTTLAVGLNYLQMIEQVSGGTATYYAQALLGCILLC